MQTVRLVAVGILTLMHGHKMQERALESVHGGDNAAVSHSEAVHVVGRSGTVVDLAV